MTQGRSAASGAQHRWAACAAAVTGQEHQRRGLGCDDAYSYGIAGDFVVAAVADGAGAYTGTSAWGAYGACRSVLTNAMEPSFLDSYRACRPEQTSHMVRWLFEQALGDVTRQAETLGLRPVQLSTTLCVGIIDRAKAVFGQVGDGVVAVERDDRIESLLIERKNDYANTTTFLQSERALEESLRTAVHDGVTAFALSTDGMTYKITDVASGRAYEPFFRDSWQHVRAGASADQFAALLSGIADDQTGDDKTMVLVASRPSATDDVRSPAAITDHSPAPHPDVGSTPEWAADDHSPPGAAVALPGSDGRHQPVPTGGPRRRFGLRGRRSR